MRRRLIRRKAPRVVDVSMVVLADEKLFVITADLGIYVKECEQFEVLVQFRNEVEKLLRILCCFDCSKL